MNAEITSPKNPLIKEVLLLQSKSRERKRENLIVPTLLRKKMPARCSARPGTPPNGMP